MKRQITIPVRGTKYHIFASVSTTGIEAIQYPTFPEGLGLTQSRLLADALMLAANWCGKNGGRGKSKGMDMPWMNFIGEKDNVVRRKFVFPTDDSFYVSAKRKAYPIGIFSNPYVTFEEWDVEPINDEILNVRLHPQRYVYADSPSASQLALIIQSVAKSCYPWTGGEW